MWRPSEFAYWVGNVPDSGNGRGERMNVFANYMLPQSGLHTKYKNNLKMQLDP